MSCSTCGGSVSANNPLDINANICSCNSGNNNPQQSGTGCCGVISVNGKTGIVNLTTTNIPEGVNQYFTIGRARGALSNVPPILYNPATGIISHDTSGITAGTYGDTTQYPIVTVNAFGHVTNIQLQTAPTGSIIGPDLTAIEALTGLGYLIRIAPDTWVLRSLIGTAGRIAISNPAGTNAASRIDLIATGVTAGVYGDSTHIPVINVDIFGRITAISTAATPAAATPPDRITDILVSGDHITIPADKIVHGIILIGTPGDTVILGSTAGTDNILPSATLDGNGKFIDNTILYSTSNQDIYISGNTNPVTIILPI